MLPLQNPSVVKTLHGRSGCDGVAKGIKEPWKYCGTVVIIHRDDAIAGELSPKMLQEIKTNKS